MNYLEEIIRDYLLDNDISNISVKHIAQHFFVSRALVYKVLNKMGYSSFEDFKVSKQVYQEEQKNKLKTMARCGDEDIKRISHCIVNSNIIYVVAYAESRLVGEYFTRQLINLNKIAIHISDERQIISYSSVIEKDDLIIFLSNNDYTKAYKKIEHINCDNFVITRTGSGLYYSVQNCVGYGEPLDELANRCERDPALEMIIVANTILSYIRIISYKWWFVAYIK